MGGYLMSLILNRRHFLGGSLLAGGLLATPAWAKEATRGISSSWTQIQAMLDATIAKKYVPGVGAAIARGTDQADFMTSGSLAFGDTTAITPDTLWRIYSMTKPVTGIAVMMLIEDGKLKMDQNVADLLPAFANPKVLTDPANSLDARPSKAPITIRNLLTHTAGLGYSIITKGPLLDAYVKAGISPGSVSRRELPGISRAPAAPSLEEFANRLGTLPLIADPGVKWSYSVSLDLLGRVIEVVSGMPFDAFLKTRLFDPLGMTSTYFQVPASEVKRLTTNHFALPTGAFPIDLGPDSVFLDKPAFPFGGAGLVSSMRDYDRFLAMLMGEGALGQTRIMGKLAANNAMSNLVGSDTIMESFVTGQGFGAGGRVTIKSGPNGEGVGTFGWGGAASTIGWVDRTRKIRASGWSQIMTQGGQPFTTEFGKTVYASL
jgi:CubicO group peptidase (beta-lactamase class C family)